VNAWLGVANASESTQTLMGKVKPLVLDSATNVRVNTEFPQTESSGIVVKFDPVTTSKTFTLYGLIVQILPTGQAPAAGDFISGQGHSGCQFVGKPSKTPYSAKLDRVGATARLEETGMGI